MEKETARRVLYDPITEEIFDLPSEECVLTVGRANENDIILSWKDISRKHAKLRISGVLVEIEDVGSSRGTRLNRYGNKSTEVTINEGESYPLLNGDRMTFGNSYKVDFYNDPKDIEKLERKVACAGR